MYGQDNDYMQSVYVCVLVYHSVQYCLNTWFMCMCALFISYRSATYLNACMLHRYFNLARARALRVLNRSHTVPKKPTAFPLSHLTKILAFNDKEKVLQIYLTYQCMKYIHLERCDSLAILCTVHRYFTLICVSRPSLDILYVA